jgi:putative Holliday junction resolvase
MTPATVSGPAAAPSYTRAVRALGIDYGARRIGLALSDASGTLASPWRVVERPRSEAETVRLVTAEIARLRAEDDGLATVVVGWPRHLDGSPNAQTPLAQAFARAIEAATGLPVVLQDERLSSVEAESRLAARDRNWRSRKQKLDAAAAAVVLQDYLDAQPRA